MQAVRGFNTGGGGIADVHANESERQSDKAEAFADDTNIFTLCNFESLLSLKNSLTDFGIVSGLKCNYNKTNIMQIGHCQPIPENIRNLGFSFVSGLKILGYWVTNNFEDSSINFDKIIAKISAMAKFCEKFSLSLPGRINICKTFLLSQVGFIASIFLTRQDKHL